MKEEIIAQWRRLFLRPPQHQLVNQQKPDGGMPHEGNAATDDMLGLHLDGWETLIVRMIDQHGLVRFGALDFDAATPEAWKAVLDVRRDILGLGLPEPLVACSGNKGFHVVVPVSEPIHAATMREFLHELRAVTCGHLPTHVVEVRPDTDRDSGAGAGNIRLLPGFHQKARMWGAFLRLDGRVLPPPPGLPSPLDMEGQIALLSACTPATPEQIKTAILSLGNDSEGGKWQGSAFTEEPRIEPNLEVLGEDEHPPCIKALLNGVPPQMQYDIANLNLAAYCRARQFTQEEAYNIARQMAENTVDHPTTKALDERLRNFRSNRNARPFLCNFARNTRTWSEAFGGILGGCQVCPARGDRGGSQKASQATGKAAGGDQAREGADYDTGGGEAPRAPGGSLLPPPVAVDLLAYAWANREALPDLSRIWPHLYAGAASTVAASNPTRAGYFGKVEILISEMPKVAQDTGRDGAERFLQQLEARIAAFDGEPGGLKEAGAAALAMARQLDARARIAEAVAAETARPSDVPASLVAQRIADAANSVLQEAATTGPLASRREHLFAELGKRDLPLVPTPFAAFNDIMGGGLRGGRLYALLAPPKAGKTTFASQLLDYAARNGHPALYLGFEMSEEQMITAALARATGINSKLIEARSLSREQAQAVAQALDAYLDKEGRLLEIREAGLTTTVSDAAAWAARVKTQHPGKTPIIVIDYLQLARLGVREIDNHPSETKRVSAVAVACKDLARSTGAVVLALSSVTKAAETASKMEGEIDVNAARDSLAIVHAADGILALQTAMVKVKKTADEEETVTPWEKARYDAEKQGDPNAALLERALQRARSFYPNRQYHARLDILRNRGETGQVFLYYEKPFHRMLQSGLFSIDEDSRLDSTFEHADVFTDFGKTDAGKKAASTPAPPLVLYRLVTDYAEASAAIAEIALKAAGTPEGAFLSEGHRVGLDIETTGIDPHTARARLLQIAAPGEPVLIVDLDKVGGLKALAKELSGLPFIAHNAVFEMGFLRKAGVRFHDGSVGSPIITELSFMPDCTLLAAHVAGCEPGSLSLRAVAKKFLAVDIDKAEQTSDWSKPDLTPEQLAYAAHDAALLLDLWPKIWAEVQDRESESVYWQVQRAQLAVTQMALNGIYFDAAEQRVLLDKLQTERDSLSEGLKAAMGGREAAGNDLQSWLEEALGGPGSTKHAAWPKTATGKLKTGEDDMKRNLALLPFEAEKAVADLLLPFKKVEKQLSAFGSSLSSHINPVTGRIHPKINLAGTVTGRMSSSQPNIQQIPRDKAFRALFKAPEGRRLVIADYGAMELRVAAQIAKEEKLLDAFRTGTDPHKLTASLILGKKVEEITKEERQLAKAINFGLLYGQGAKGLAAYAASTYGVEMSEEAAAKHRRAWFEAYPAFEAWHATLARDARRALEVRTPAGRVRRWPHADKDKLGGFRVTEAYNTPVQGGAAEAMLAAMELLSVSLNGQFSGKYCDAEMVAVVHDELIVEAAEAHSEEVKARLEEAMIEGFLKIFPGAPTTGLVEARIARSWAEK